MEFVKDARYRLLADHGNEPGANGRQFHPEGLQNEDGTLTVHPVPDGFPLRAGMTGTVEAVVAAEEEGAGSMEEDHVVLSFVDDQHEPGRPVSRHVSFTQAEMESLFELAELPPEHLQVHTTSDDPNPPRHFQGRAWDGRPEHEDVKAAWEADRQAAAPAPPAQPAQPAAPAAQEG